MNSIEGEYGMYWYEFYESYCPLCGCSNIEKSRVYDRPKPESYNERHIVEEHWDYCGWM